MTAVVLGLDVNGLGVVRALGQAGVPAVGVDGVLSHAGRASRYCRAVVDADPCRADALLAALDRLRERLDGPAVLLPTMDDTVRILSQHRSRIGERFRLALPDAGTVTRLIEKADLAELAREHGWPVPRTAVCRNAAQVAQVAEQFPCPGVMKPGRRELGAPRGIPRKLWSFGNPAEILAAYAELSRWEATVVLQELVPGPDSAVFFCLFYCDAEARPRALFVGRKIRQFPPLYGNTSSSQPAEQAQVREFSRRFIRDVAYRGLGSIEMKVDPRSGRAFLIEPTVGRTDYQSYLAVVNGVNIPEIAYRDLAGLAPAAARPRSRPVKYLVAFDDLRSARRQRRRDGRPGWGAYLRSLEGRKAFALWQLRDPGPFLYRIHYATLGRALRVGARAFRRIFPGGTVPSPRR